MTIHWKALWGALSDSTISFFDSTIFGGQCIFLIFLKTPPVLKDVMCVTKPVNIADSDFKNKIAICY
jgi:hypothetical protein